MRTTNTASRVSVPIFNAPLPVAIIGPFPELVASDGVARYRDINYKEYTNNIDIEKPCGRKMALEFVSI